MLCVSVCVCALYFYLPQTKSSNAQYVPKIVVIILTSWIQVKPQHENMMRQETNDKHCVNKNKIVDQTVDKQIVIVFTKIDLADKCHIS